MITAGATKDQWLAHLESIHPANIEMGLGRVTKVAEQLDLFKPAPVVIVVGGTNGKGTTTALLGQLLAENGLTSACYNSPHIHEYNERINRRDSVNSMRLSTDDELCKAFSAIELGRGDITLTYFEFGTLAALWQIKQWHVDVAILEVGLGGRLDAVNIVDTDLAIVTSVGLDHQDWLGDTLDLIGMEKAGIARANKPLICGQLEAPKGFIKAADQLNAKTFYQGIDFSIAPSLLLSKKSRNYDDGWQWVKGDQIIALPRGHIPFYNIASAIAGLEAIGLLPDIERIQSAVDRTKVPGRLTHISCEFNGTPVTFILDVAHNAQAAGFLADQVQDCSVAILAMLADKDPAAVVSALPCIESWHLANLQGYRGQTSHSLLERIVESESNGADCNWQKSNMTCHETVKLAMISGLKDVCSKKLNDGNIDHKILIIGSFLTVSAAEKALVCIDGLLLK